MEASEPTGRRKQRSPSYPGIGLEPAIARAHSLHDEMGRAPTNVDVALRTLGYGPNSGGGRVILAALKKYGLIEDEGSRDRRQVRLTPLALDIILDDRTVSPGRDEAIRTAALTPAIHRELWDRYEGALPGDDTLSTYLRRERAFTESAVKDFVPQFRGTVAFAKLANGGTVSPDVGDKDPAPQHPPEAEKERPMTGGTATLDPPPKVNPTAPPVVNVPFGSGEQAQLQLTARISQAEWEQFMAVLNAMKPGLTTPDP